jgi:hypothetical protein
MMKKPWMMMMMTARIQHLTNMSHKCDNTVCFLSKISEDKYRCETTGQIHYCVCDIKTCPTREYVRFADTLVCKISGKVFQNELITRHEMVPDKRYVDADQCVGDANNKKRTRKETELRQMFPEWNQETVNAILLCLRQSPKTKMNKNSIILFIKRLRKNKRYKYILDLVKLNV